MRLLIVTPFLPWPLNTGGNAAQYSTLEAISRDHEVTLICSIYGETGARLAEELRCRLPALRLVTPNCAIPMHGIGGLARKTLLWWRSRRKTGREGIGGPQQFSPLAPRVVEALQSELRRGCDLCQFEFVETITGVHVLPPDVPALFVHHQLQFMYSERAAMVAGDGDTAFARYIARWMKQQELDLLNQYRAVVTFSETDAALLRQNGCRVPLHVSPFPVPSDVGFLSEPRQAFSGTFVFLGSQVHEPNRDALGWLTGEIWPQLRAELPEARLRVIGKWDESWTGKSNGLEFVSFAEDLGAALARTIMLVPVRIGSGIRTKILAALAQGVPVVSTTIGAEGIGAAHGQHLLLGDSVSELVEQAKRLARDPALYRALGVESIRFAQERFSLESVRRRRNAIYQEVLAP